MPAKVTEYVQVVKATDAASPALKSAGDSVQTFAGRLKALRSEAAASGELGAERLFRNPERLLGLLTGQGLGLAISSFAFRELGSMAEGAAVAMEKVRKGEESVAQGMLDIAKSIPILGEAVRAADAIGRLFRLGVGFDPEGDKAKTEAMQKARDGVFEYLLKESGRHRLSMMQGQEKAAEEARQKYADLQKQREAERAKAIATAREQAEQDVAAKFGARPGDISSYGRLRQKKEEEAAKQAADFAAASAGKRFDQIAEQQRIEALASLDKAEQEAFDSRDRIRRDNDARYRETTASIEKNRSEVLTATLRSFGLEYRAKASELSAQFDADVSAIREKYAKLRADVTEFSPQEASLLNEEAAVVESRRQKFLAEAAAARVEDKETRARTLAEKLAAERQHAEAVMNLDRDVTRQRVQLYKDEAESANDPRAQRIAKLYEIHEQYRAREEELNKLMHDGNATLSQRLQIMGLIKQGRADEAVALRRAAQATYEQTTGFSLDTNVGASYFQASPRQTGDDLSDLVKQLVKNTGPDALPQALAAGLKIAFPVLGSITGIYAGAQQTN